MSSKIIRGELEALQPRSWRPVHQSGDALSSGMNGQRVHSESGGADGNSGAGPQPVDVEEIREMLSREFEARLQQERAAAFEAGQREAELAAQAAARQELLEHYERLSRSIEDLAGCRDRYRSEVEHEAVQLSLEIARRILRRELTVDPEAVLGLLRAALEPVSMREVLEVRIHPSHAEIVRDALHKTGAPAAIAITGDPHLEPGAVLVETRRGGFDASAETQLDEIQRGFADLMERNARR